MQQLENERRESARFRELIESHRSEIFITKKEVEKISKEVRALNIIFSKCLTVKITVLNCVH